VNDLATQIRLIIEESVDPMSADEVIDFATERRPKPFLTTDHHRPIVVLVGVGVGLAAAAIGLVVVAGRDNSHPMGSHANGVSADSAHTVLIREAALASAQPPLVPGPNQWLYVQTASGSISGAGFKTATWYYYIQDVSQQWTSPTGSNASSGFATGQPQFLTDADRAAWQAAGSPPIENGGGGSLPAGYYDVSNLPTDPSQMAAYFATQTQIHGAADPSPVTQFDVAAGFLSHGASSVQRGALFQYMATLPGVKNLGITQALGSGKSGQTLAVLGTLGRQVEVVIDPSTTEILEERVVVADSSQLGAGEYPREMQAGEVLNYSDFVYAGIADSSGSAPADAPPVPTIWFPNTARSPQTAVAYPHGK
jgi:hypothetical protein